jgi:hypothetical protein
MENAARLPQGLDNAARYPHCPTALQQQKGFFLFKGKRKILKKALTLLLPCLIVGIAAAQSPDQEIEA